jgi:hypothetical protein
MKPSDSVTLRNLQPDTAPTAQVTEVTISSGGLWPLLPDADREARTYLISWALVVVILMVADRPAWRMAPSSATEP